MLVRMNTTYARGSVTAGPGQVIEVDDKEGKALIAGDYANEFDPDQPRAIRGRRQATSKADETAGG